MMTRISELLALEATVNGDRLAISEIFFDSKSGALRHIALHVNDWIAGSEALVQTDFVERPQPDQGVWPVNVDRATIEQAPRWTDEDTEPHDEAGSLFDLSNWPPLIVGPFGGTYAPMLLQAQIAEEGFSHPERAANEADAQTPPEVDPALLRGLSRGSEWLGREAFGDDGSLGTIKDLLVDAEAFRVTHLVLETADQGLRTLPLSRFRYTAKGGSHAVLRAAKADLDAAPAPDALIGA